MDCVLCFVRATEGTEKGHFAGIRGGDSSKWIVTSRTSGPPPSPKVNLGSSAGARVVTGFLLTATPSCIENAEGMFLAKMASRQPMNLGGQSHDNRWRNDL